MERPAVLAQLERVLAAPEFARSDRAARFLRLIVERTLDSATDQLKETLLAIDAFGRPADFDPKADPVVRVEAIKLRRRLEDYYARETREPVRISIPKGRYVAEFHSPREQQPARRIAVSPVQDLHRPAGPAWFAAGLTEELIAALAAVPGLLVVCRKSRAVAGARDFRLESSVRRDTGQTRVAVRLSDSSGVVLWTVRFDVSPEGSIATQEAIAAAVARHLGLHLPQIPTPRRQVAPAAWESYAHGRFELHSTAQGSVERARVCFERAIALDPSYAAPHTQIVRTLLAGAIAGHGFSDRSLADAQQALVRAIALDAEFPETHVARGTLLSRCLYQWSEGEESFRCALALDPALAEAHYALAQECLLPQARFPEALCANLRAIELEPGSRLFRIGVPWIRLFAGEVGAARSDLDQLLAVDPTFLFARLAAAYAAMIDGDSQAAIGMLEPFAATVPIAGAWLSLGYSQAGRAEDAARMRQCAFQEEAPPGTLGLYEVAVGNVEAALDLFHKAIDAHDPNVCLLAVDPLMQPLRDMPGFRRLLLYLLNRCCGVCSFLGS